MVLDSQQIENTFYGFQNDAITEIDLENVASHTLAWAEGEYFPQLASVLSLKAVKTTDLTTDTSPTFTYFAPTAIVGGVVQPSLPNATAWAVKRLTAQRGRSGRGRVFVPGIPDTARVGTNLLDIDFATAIVAAMVELDSVLLTDGFTGCVVTRFHDGEPRAVGVPQPITSWGYSDLVLDSQRRRGPGRGS
jgi:hypothetical protein